MDPKLSPNTKYSNHYLGGVEVNVIILLVGSKILVLVIAGRSH